jgi:hypothetical protein
LSILEVRKDKSMETASIHGNCVNSLILG